MDHTAGCPVSGNFLAGQIVDDLFAVAHGGVFLFISGFCGFLMQIAVESDIVSPAGDFFYDLRVMLSYNSGNEEGCLHLVAVQHIEDSRNALFGAIGAAGEVGHMGGASISVCGPHGFCIQVKCHHDGNPFFIRPVHHALFPPFCCCT